MYVCMYVCICMYNEGITLLRAIIKDSPGQSW